MLFNLLPAQILVRSLNYYEAYAKAAMRVVDCAKLFFRADLQSLSVYLLSSANLSRGRDDLEAVFDAETSFLSGVLPSVADELQCKIVHAGRISLLPPTMQFSLNRLCERTKHFSGRTLYLILGYDPLDEINAAVELCLLRGEPLDMSAHFWVPEKVDAVIRTAGGPNLLSNFLPLQCGYARIYTLEKYFLDCTDEDFMGVLVRTESSDMLYGA